MDIEKKLDDCLVKIRLMKKYFTWDLEKLSHLSNDLELIKKHQNDAQRRSK